MSALSQLYSDPLALLTDLYQVTMASAYHREGIAEREAVFHLFFRRPPFGGGYAIAAGLDLAVDLLENFRLRAVDIAYLASLRGNDGDPLFANDFLAAMATLRFTGDVDAIPEGTVVFAQEPLLRIRGPIIQCQLLETALLNIVNFSTLIATKAARICEAAAGDPVLEFGLRRAQGIDGAVTASRAAVIGGCAATSNCLAGRLYDLPVRGTHAHAWVMAFPDELEAFLAYARALPNNCVFLVDTYDTIEGIHRAITVGHRLREQGHAMVGIRLDSGDLCALSVAARELLDTAGFPEARIVASDDLDEHRIAALKAKGARIDTWGVGTRLATAYDQPALGGVYKLAAIREPGAGVWSPRIKLSEQPIKVSIPGIQQVRRIHAADGRLLGDLIYDEELGPSDRGRSLIDGAPLRLTGADPQDLLQPIFRGGARVSDSPPVAAIQARAQAQLAALDPSHRLLRDPAPYPVGLEEELAARREALIAAARRGAPTTS